MTSSPPDSTVPLRPITPADREDPPRPDSPRSPYIVDVREVHIQPKRVMAASEADAIARVRHGEGDDLEGGFEYSHTMDSSTWTVSKVNDPSSQIPG